MTEAHDCHQLLGTLSDYVDGDLRAELCQQLEEHLRHCENCRVVVNTLRKTIEVYRENAAADALPGEVRGRLYARLDLNDLLPIPAVPGALCPRCGQGVLDYDSLLVLRCPVCGFSQPGCST